MHGAAAAMDAKLRAIEAAFASRVPATLSILLEEAAITLERAGQAGAEALLLASHAAYRPDIGEARAHFDRALRDLRRDT